MVIAEALAVLAALGLSVLATLAQVGSGRSRPGQVLFAGAFAAATLAWLARLLAGGQAPLQSLYDVFLTLAALMYPLAVLCRRLAGATPAAADPLLMAALLVPVAFFLPPQPRPLPPALDSWLFVPHVGAYLLAYVLLVKASLAGLSALVVPGRAEADEAVGCRLVGMGFPLLTAGLVLGALWGQQAWGDWWNWDPKELWSLATWLLFVLYLHVRGRGPARRRAAAALLAAGGVLVVVTLLWVNLASRFGGLHTYAN